jgi:hypothetical protein
MLVLLTITTSIVTASSLACSFIPKHLLSDNAKKTLKILALNFNNVHYNCKHNKG